ncbi:hypothetical protein M407DRAFT_246842 [Tulasnella calospora MUT 4182]|uniref:Uncharacterized protein n=1 Tax=Tulasnella calospora MUT 4182 TaxID=1051891 RepID=A0A0C3Q3D9_9AGAM|nr:hypothetical protein M407DRAFT_246842 [Tulasnella calospora MUT 4182]
MKTPGYKTQRMLKSRVSGLSSGYFRLPTAFTRAFDVFGPPFKIISITSSGSPRINADLGPLKNKSRLHARIDYDDSIRTIP